MNPVERLFISFSGGKTSAYLTQRLLREWRSRYRQIVVGFANTGEEHEKTLEYVDACDKAMGFDVVWLEAVVDPRPNHGTSHRIVNFKTASRKGEPFEEAVRKYGLPNHQYFHCTRELKLRPMRSYLRSLGWEAGTYHSAVGIRFDELDRMSPRSMAEGVIYPLIDMRVTKPVVLQWDREFSPVRLGIPEHYGNCKWCWKKSFRKLGTVALEMPKAMDFPAYLERTYADAGAGAGDRRLFRGRRTTSDIFALARDPSFEPYVDDFPFKDEELDLGSSCGESCEIGVDSSEEVPAYAGI